MNKILTCGANLKTFNTSVSNLQFNLIPKSLIHAKANKDAIIPQSKGLPIIGTTLFLILAGGAPKLHLYIDKKHRKFGRIFKEKMGNIEAVFISDPEYMRSIFAQEGKYPVHLLPEAWTLYNQLFGCSRGLFFMNSEEWLHNRRVMNNFLLKGDLNYIENATEFIAPTILTKLETRSDHLENILYRWSLDNVVAVLLGRDVAHLSNFDAKLQHIAKTVHLIFQTSAKLQLIPASLAARLKIKAWKNFVKSVDVALCSANDLVYDLIKSHPNGNGLLNLMLNQNMPKSDVIKIIVDLVLAAGDTTAYTMQWILYCLAKNPHIQHQLYSNPNDEALFKNVLKEALRMYPVAPFLTRILPEDAAIPPYTIPKNSLIILSLYTSGRDPNFFLHPNNFMPERWANKTANMVQASLPFAMGSRSCIGRKIAELQVLKTLQAIVKYFKIELGDDEEVEIVLKMVAVPSKPLNLKFVRR